MAPAKILAASKDGAYVIRMVGDVRLTLCTTIEEYFDEMLADADFVSVAIDLCEAEGLDSTTLGLLAKLALKVRDRYDFMPVAYSSQPGITRLLKSMGFQRLFDIREEQCGETRDSEQLPVVNGSEKQVKQQVLDAHRVLMDLNDANREKFKDLMAVLEQD